VVGMKHEGIKEEKGNFSAAAQIKAFFSFFNYSKNCMPLSCHELAWSDRELAGGRYTSRKCTFVFLGNNFVKEFSYFFFPNKNIKK
jgi:hypothetical protein